MKTAKHYPIRVRAQLVAPCDDFELSWIGDERMPSLDCLDMGNYRLTGVRDHGFDMDGRRWVTGYNHAGRLLDLRISLTQ